MKHTYKTSINQNNIKGNGEKCLQPKSEYINVKLKRLISVAIKLYWTWKILYCTILPRHKIFIVYSLYISCKLVVNRWNLTIHWLFDLLFPPRPKVSQVWGQVTEVSSSRQVLVGTLGLPGPGAAAVFPNCDRCAVCEYLSGASDCQAAMMDHTSLSTCCGPASSSCLYAASAAGVRHHLSPSKSSMMRNDVWELLIQSKT